MNEVEQLARTLVRVGKPDSRLEPNAIGTVVRASSWSVTLALPNSEPVDVGNSFWSPLFSDQVASLGTQLLNRKVLVHFAANQPVVAYAIGGSNVAYT